MFSLFGFAGFAPFKNFGYILDFADCEEWTYDDCESESHEMHYEDSGPCDAVRHAVEIMNADICEIMPGTDPCGNRDRRSGCCEK